MNETVTLTITPEVAAVICMVGAGLAYPMWGAITAGLWGRALGVTKPMYAGEKAKLTLLAAAWPVALPTLLVAKAVGGVYGPITKAFLQDHSPKS